MRKVYFQRYLKLEKLARLGVGYLTYLGILCKKADLSNKSINILDILESGTIFWMNLVSLSRIFKTQISPKTWIRTVYFQRYLKLDILARLGVGYLMYLLFSMYNVVSILQSIGSASQSQSSNLLMDLQQYIIHTVDWAKFCKNDQIK